MSTSHFIPPRPGWSNARAHKFQLSDPERNSADWTLTECADLVKSYLSGVSVQDLAIQHQRKVNAIETRLARAESILS